MPRACTICAHPERNAMDTAIIRGEPNRRIATRCVVSEAAIRRHHTAGHITAAIARAAEASEATRGEDLLNQVRSLADHALGILQAAEADGDRRHALGAIREARACLELLGRVAGELGPDVNVQVTAATALVGRAAVEDPEARKLVLALRDRVAGTDAGEAVTRGGSTVGLPGSSRCQ